MRHVQRKSRNSGWCWICWVYTVRLLPVWAVGVYSEASDIQQPGQHHESLHFAWRQLLAGKGESECIVGLTEAVSMKVYMGASAHLTYFVEHQRQLLFWSKQHDTVHACLSRTCISFGCKRGRYSCQAQMEALKYAWSWQLCVGRMTWSVLRRRRLVYCVTVFMELQIWMEGEIWGTRFITLVYCFTCPGQFFLEYYYSLFV